MIQVKDLPNVHPSFLVSLYQIEKGTSTKEAARAAQHRFMRCLGGERRRGVPELTKSQRKGLIAAMKMQYGLH